MNIPNNQAGSGSIPTIEDGIYAGRFNGVEVRVVEEFKTEKDKFGKPDDGTRYDFATTVLTEDREPVMLVDVQEGADDPTEEFVIRRTAKTVKVFSGGEKSNSYMYLKGILTPAEMALFQESGKGDEQADAMWQAAAAKVDGRIVMMQVTHNDKGWPQIEAFLGPAKPPKAAK
jgi:hypothetical protein